MNLSPSDPPEFSADDPGGPGISRRSALMAGAGAITLGGLSTLLAACGGEAAGAGTGAATIDQLVVSTVTGATVFDPELPASALGQSLLLYDSLFDTSTPADREEAQKLLADFDPQPALATAWEATKDDNSAWTLTLNTDVLSPFGNSFSSADVLWSFERHLAMQWYGGIFLNRIGITDISQVSAPTADTVELELSGPVGRTYFLQMLGCFIVPIFDSTEAAKHTSDDDPWASDWISKNACGFGPYTLTSVSDDGSQAVFAANPNYYGTKPFQTLTWRQTTETSTQLQLLLRGEAHIVDSLSPVQVASVQDSSTAKVTSTSTTGAAFIGFNNSLADYQDVALHQGMAYALPFDEIVNSVYQGQASAMKSVLPDFFQGATDEFWTYDQDLDRATTMLAPYADADLTLQYRGGDATLQTLAVLIQSSLKTAGLTITLEAMDPTSFQTKLTDATLGMWIDTQSTPLVPDALYGLQLLFPTEPTQVLIHYSNPDVDTEIAALATSFDEDEQIAHIRAAQELLIQDLPILPLAQIPGMVPTAQQISGIRAHGANFLWAKGLTTD